MVEVVSTQLHRAPSFFRR